MSADGRRWLSYARADLHVAEVLRLGSEVPGRIVCFHAQQAAEKAVKAALVEAAGPFRKSHDVVVLAGLAPGELATQLERLDVAVLQPWAVDGRYPGDLPDATALQVSMVVAAATAVLACVTEWIRREE